MPPLEETPLEPTKPDRSALAVLIPAWQPDDGLLRLVEQLIDHGFGAVLVVDDGSRRECAPVFAAVGRRSRVHVLRHAVNLGKGRALKTGINYFLTSLPGFDGLVTADADGQHLPTDIVRVADALAGAGGNLVLGSRRFPRSVPLRNRLGNLLTRQVFRCIAGIKLADTQTGLRGLPRFLLPGLMALQGERYEYEMRVLAHACRLVDKPLEIPIETVYVDGNRSSHFDPVWDSLRIYATLARFYGATLLRAAHTGASPRREQAEAGIR